MSHDGTTVEKKWTEPQRRAIEHVGGDLLVSAAAGSGKTAVLAERCARLVCENIEGGCGVDGLLVLTFTEAAANEMRSRIAAAIREKLKGAERITPERSAWLLRQAAMVERASISTLHAFCARVLRQHFHEAQIDPAFEMVDEEEARLMREEAMDDVLARWHKLPMEDGRAAAFAAFFEAYAQGRDSGCREMVQRVYTMLSTTANPAKYVDETRKNYIGDGCVRMFDRFAQEVVAGRLRLLGIAAGRAVQDANRNAGPDAPISVGLLHVAALIETSRQRLEAEGAAALPGIRDALLNPWPKQLRTMPDVADFEELKERTWNKMKSRLKGFCESVLVHSAEEMIPALGKLSAPLNVLLSLVEDFERTYAAAKRSLNRLDFSDLERLTLTLLTGSGSLAAAELRSRYQHILVDEFQDINPLQEALLNAVRSADRFAGAGNLFVVGDVKQSIYGFRLADPELFLMREKQALITGGGRGHVALPHNFRSQKKLLAAMNGLFEKMLTPEVAGVTYQDGHVLQPSPAVADAPSNETGLRTFDGTPVELHVVAMDQEEEDPEQHNDDDSQEDAAPRKDLSAIEKEARMVASRIAALMTESRGVVGKDGAVRKLAYRDIAILLRSMKDKAMIFARALAQRGIPVHADLSTGYFDTAEVRDTLALLQVLDNPQQDIPLATVLLGPYGNFSHDDLAVVRLTYDQKKVSFAAAVHRYVLSEDHPADMRRNPPEHDAELVNRLTAFLKKLSGWRGILHTRPLHEGLARIYSDARIMPFLAGLEAGDQRVANLQALHQRALKFAGFSKQGLHRFLRFIEKLRDQDGDFGEAPVLSEASDVVRIMSVHKSKGLEFPVVIVAGMGSQLNLPATGPVFVHRKIGIGMHVADAERNVFYASAASACIVNDNERTSRAEELRLLYVALTRARDHLILSGHVAKGEWLLTQRTEFAGNAGPLPEDLLVRGRRVLEWIVPALASSSMRVQWPDRGKVADAQVEITLHQETREPAIAHAEEPEKTEWVRRLMAGVPLPTATTPETAVQDLIARVTGTYAHAELAKQPAVWTVSKLKTIGAEEVEAAEVLPRVFDALRSEEALERGIATHRLLERLDFSRCDGKESLAVQIETLVAKNRITPEDAARADLEGIAWLLTTPTAERVIGAAKNKTGRIRREIPFTWSAPDIVGARSEDPADWPTIRGTIDLLLVDPLHKTAEILDYKTDSAFNWERNLPDYERQMRYYLRAASDILGFPVTRATLLFLSAKQLVEVTP